MAQMQTGTITQDKEPTVRFRCPQQWRNEVEKRLIDMGETFKTAGIKALSLYTGVPLPESISDDPGDSSAKDAA